MKLALNGGHTCQVKHITHMHLNFQDLIADIGTQRWKKSFTGLFHPYYFRVDQCSIPGTEKFMKFHNMHRDNYFTGEQCKTCESRIFVA